MAIKARKRKILLGLASNSALALLMTSCGGGPVDTSGVVGQLEQSELYNTQWDCTTTCVDTNKNIHNVDKYTSCASSSAKASDDAYQVCARDFPSFTPNPSETKCTKTATKC